MVYKLLLTIFRNHFELHFLHYTLVFFMYGKPPALSWHYSGPRAVHETINCSNN